jgi:pimeloyl-ACP methyl ester carboxylesterase
MSKGALFMGNQEIQNPLAGVAFPLEYKTLNERGVRIFYREAGPKKASVILLLHGFPSPSRMFATLIPLLADTYHLIAPGYPGFGHSDVSPPETFSYTFDHLAECMDKFTEQLALPRNAVSAW